jgi:hypothetical protein
MENGLIGRDEARDVFWSLGLTYGSALKKKYIGKLLEMLDVSFAEAKKKAKLDPMTGKKDVYWEKTLKTVSKPRPDPFGRKTAVCYIQASGAYFKKRECISFNPSMDDERKHEWIGFCGDASDENADIDADVLRVVRLRRGRFGQKPGEGIFFGVGSIGSSDSGML